MCGKITLTGLKCEILLLIGIPTSKWFSMSFTKDLLGEWQVKNPAACGCLTLLPRVITCLYLVRVVKKVAPKWRGQWLSTVVELLNKWLFLFALGEVAGEVGKPPSSVLMALCSCCRRCLCCITLNACCYMGPGTAPLPLAWPLVQA